MKDKIIYALKNTGREDVQNLINFLEQSDFFTAPCSTKYHLACAGGLAQHTWNVLDTALGFNERYNICSEESVIITAVCHDLCKVNFYKLVNDPPTDAQMRYLTSLMSKAGLKVPTQLNKNYTGILIDFMLHSYKKGEPLPPYIDNYEVNDICPLGHGEKSLYIAQQLIKLTLDEALAIRWHMGMSDAGVHTDFPSGFAYKSAIEKSKLVSLIQLADMEASFLMEA